MRGCLFVTKKLIAAALILCQVLLFGCAGRTVTVVEGQSSYHEKGVTITNKGNYFNVVLDYTSGLTNREMGAAYARGILKVVPNFESLVDSYISEINNDIEYRNNMYNKDGLVTQIDKRYMDEIEGMASVLSKDYKNQRNDNKISKDELYLYNLIADIGQGTQCSFVSVYGSRSATGSTIAGRNLEWFGGQYNQISQIQAVITFIYPQKKICSIGYLGYMGILTGINDSKNFAAILLAPTGEAYNSQGKRSFPLDLRTALETYDTIEEIADYMKDSKKYYANNHIIALSDPDKSIILENNISGFGPHGSRVKRAIRTADSRLNDGVTWGISDAIGSVNSFLLYGNYDNHTHEQHNNKRWENMKKQLLAGGDKVTPEELKSVITYDNGSPGAAIESGDIYNRETTQMVLFQPKTMSLEVYFRPKTSERNPDTPIFVKVPVFENN